MFLDDVVVFIVLDRDMTMFIEEAIRQHATYLLPPLKCCPLLLHQHDEPPHHLIGVDRRPRERLTEVPTAVCASRESTSRITISATVSDGRKAA